MRASFAHRQSLASLPPQRGVPWSARLDLTSFDETRRLEPMMGQLHVHYLQGLHSMHLRWSETPNSGQ